MRSQDVMILAHLSAIVSGPNGTLVTPTDTRGLALPSLFQPTEFASRPFTTPPLLSSVDKQPLYLFMSTQSFGVKSASLSLRY
jgi:hypothetical protein